MPTKTQKAARLAASNSNAADLELDESPVPEKGERLAGVLQITAPKFRTVKMHIIGTAPLVMHKFSQKILQGMADKQKLGSQAKKGQKRDPKDFEGLYEGAKHISREGWIGIPAAAFRNALISACRLVGFKMTLMKMAVFIKADGYDKDEGTPLVKITKGEPHQTQMAVRLATGVPDVSVRPMWDEWEAEVRVRFDNDILSVGDVSNLMMRVGQQVGILEGRPDSKQSAGMGWGLFDVDGKLIQEADV